MYKSFLASYMNETENQVASVHIEEHTTANEVHVEEETSTLIVKTDEPVNPEEAEVVVQEDTEFQDDGTTEEVTTVVVTDVTEEVVETPYEVQVIDETVEEEVATVTSTTDEDSAAMSFKDLFERKLTILAKMRNEVAPTYVRAFSTLRNARVDANKFSNIRVKKVSSFKALSDCVNAALFINKAFSNIKTDNISALNNVANALNETMRETGTESFSLDYKSLKDLGYTPSNLIKLANTFNVVANDTIKQYSIFATDVCNNVTKFDKVQKKLVKDINRKYTELSVYLFGDVKMQLRKMILALDESANNPSYESLMVSLPKFEIPTIEEVTDFAEHKDSQESKTICDTIAEIEKKFAPSTKDDDLSDNEISKIGDDISVSDSFDKPLPSEELANTLSALATSIHLNGLNKQAYEFLIIFGVPDIMFKYKKHFPAVEDFNGTSMEAELIADSLDKIAEGIIALS